MHCGSQHAAPNFQVAHCLFMLPCAFFHVYLFSSLVSSSVVSINVSLLFSPVSYLPLIVLCIYALVSVWSVVLLLSQFHVFSSVLFMLLMLRCVLNFVFGFHALDLLNKLCVCIHLLSTFMTFRILLVAVGVQNSTLELWDFLFFIKNWK